ncbi:hypothetical protein H1R20_g16026, partial [Candolleomyces eurysporus]
MVANVPGAWPSSHRPSSRSVPDLTLRVDKLNDHSPRNWHRENNTIDYSRNISTSAHEGLRPVATLTDQWEQNNQYRADPGIAFEQPILSAQSVPHFLDRLRPVNGVKANESFPPDPSVDTARLSRSFLRNAHHFQMGDLNHFEAPNATHVTNNTVVTSGSTNGWEILQKHTAPNALHDSDARYDAPKCDEDTRVEVTGELMGWIKDRSHPQQLLCMTGAAGSGKSALQQSIAECCAKDKILGAAYFISAADSNRNTASTIVPTIAYQLGLNHPILRRFIAAEVEHDPLIFSRSLKAQMNVLIVRPFESLRRSEECDLSTFPYAILIDGLDECQGDTNTTDGLGRVRIKYKAEDRQAELLSAIKHSLLTRDLPFRIFVASRPEWAIHTALGSTATNTTRQRICVGYLQRRFQDIGLRIGQPDWFTEDNIETLVQAGSGQFVYVATVYKYVSERRASPAHMLKTVLGWKPWQATRPFEALDILYTNILLDAKEAYEAVDAHGGRDFLCLFEMFCMDAGGDLSLFGKVLGAHHLSALLNLESNVLEILTLDLRSLVYLVENEAGTMHLAVYHKSLSDFMNEAGRAKDLFVPSSRVYTHLAKCYMQHIIESPELHSLPDKQEDMSVSEQCLKTAITGLRFLKSAVAIDDEIVEFTQKGGWDKIDMILSEPLGFGIIFSRYWGYASNWIEYIGDAAALNKDKPEAAAVMSKYLEKWKPLCRRKEREHYLECQSKVI